MLLLLNKFTEEDLKQFGLFIRSPFHNSYSTLIKLYEYVMPIYPRISKKDISLRKISAVVYKERKVNELKVRKLLSDFGEVIESFLLNTEMQTNAPVRDLSLLTAYSNREYKNRYKTFLKKLRRSYEKSSLENESDYLRIYGIEKENYGYMKFLSDKNIWEPLMKKSRSLDYFFVYEKLRYYHDCIMSEIYLTKDMVPDKLFYKEILAFAEDNIKEIKKRHPYMYLYYKLVLFYENYDLKYMDELSEYYNRSYKKFSRELYFDFNNAVLTAYSKMRSKQLGDVNAITERLFEIYDGLFMRNKGELEKYFGIRVLHSNNFMTIAGIGISMRKHEWVKAFIDRYKDQMSDEYMEDHYNIVMMDYNYLIKKYEESISYGIQVSGKVPNYFTTSRIMVIRAYYELGDLRTMHTYFENLKQYFKRKKPFLNDYDHYKLKTFILIFSRFIRITEKEADKKTKAKQLEELRFEIEKLGYSLDSRRWFLEKIKSMGFSNNPTP